MSIIVECTACQMGDHKRHQHVVRAVPKGMMGGAICTCRGECKDRTPEERAERLGITPILEMFAEAQREESK